MKKNEGRSGLIVSMGECMLELSDRPEGCRLGFGGDTLNTALYLARLGAAVEYVTVLGDDPYSDHMVEAWRSEGVGTRFVRREADRLPGFYAIRTDADGERRFYYWRQQAPVRELLKGEGEELVAQALSQAGLIYLSGITVSILDEAQRDRLLRLLASAREQGAWIAFDPNYRPAGWPNAETARRWFDAFYGLSTHALPSLDDERALGMVGDEQAVIERLTRLGAPEVVVKAGGRGCWISAAGEVNTVPPVEANCIDSTAAGDSFNAGYLAARMDDLSPQEAARRAHLLAAAVVSHPGAIIPREFMPEIMEREAKIG